MIKRAKRQSGFTLIEVVIYLAIVSIILVSISYLIIDIMAGQTKSYANQDVNQNLRFITNYLDKDIKSAQDIGTFGDTLVLTMAGDDTTYNFNSIDKTITRQLGIGPAVVLNTNRTEVTGSFSNLSYLSRAKNVEIQIVVNYKNPGNTIDYKASISANFSVELRGRR